jgi:hypothetical protein
MMGRIQTRLFLVLIVGGIWTLIISPFLPGTDGAPLSEVYKVTFKAIIIVAAFGIVWDFIWQGIMWLRWEKDWPFIFQFLQGIPEGITTYGLLKLWLPGHVAPPMSTFLTLFITTWLVTLAFGNTFIRVLFPRHRFRGGYLIGGDLSKRTS